jgi:fatty acid desaturase
MLRYPADVRTLSFVLGYYGLLIAEWHLIPVHSFLVVPFVILTAVLSFICAVITHNTLHCPVFKERYLNRAFQIALTCSYGFPVSEYVPGHNLSHHKHTQKRADLMRTSKARFTRWNILNLLVFFPRVGGDIFLQNHRYIGIVKRALPAWYHQLVLEMVFCWGEKVLLILLDWRRALLFVFLPHLFAVYAITTVNFLQHDGADADHRYNHSRNFVGRIFNWFTFNNGFHGIHHDHPGLHWSLTAAAHAREIHGHIDPRLEQRSLLLYMFSAFIYPGTRRYYDGQELAPPAAGRDEEWIPHSLQSAYADLGAVGAPPSRTRYFARALSGSTPRSPDT